MVLSIFSLPGFILIRLSQQAIYHNIITHRVRSLSITAL